MAVSKPLVSKKQAANLSPRNEREVKFIVLHHSGGKYPGDLEWLTRKDSNVSCDFYINSKGKIWQLNPDLRKYYTWHAGKSYYQGFYDINKYSIGIELEYCPGNSKWTLEQVNACSELVAWLIQEFNLDVNSSPVTSHQRVALPKGRKIDPQDFPWSIFSKLVRYELIK